jgi:hypothetical protein
MIIAADVFLEPEKTETEIKKNFTINITTESQEEIFGIDITINKINGIKLASYNFTNITENSIKHFLEKNDTIRFGIIFKDNGITGKNKIIEITYYAEKEVNENLTITNIYLSDKNGQEIKTNTSSAEIITKEKKINLICIGTKGEKDEEIEIKIYAETKNTELKEIKFSQIFDDKIEHIRTDKTNETENSTLIEKSEKGKIEISLKNTSIKEKINILNIMYKIINTEQNISEINFLNISASDKEGNPIETIKQTNCILEIIKKEETPQNTAVITRGGGGGGGKRRDTNTEETPPQNPTNLFHAYSEILEQEENYEEQKENTLLTQEFKEEEQKTEKIEETKDEKIEEKRGLKSLPIAIISLTILISLSVVLILEIKK